MNQIINLSDKEWLVFNVLVLLLLPASIFEVSLAAGHSVLNGYGEVVFLTIIGFVLGFAYKLIDESKDEDS